MHVRRTQSVRTRTRAGIDVRGEYGEPAVPFENNAAQQFVQMDQLARLPGERDERKRTATGGRWGEKNRERERERKRGGLPQGYSTVLRTSAQWLLALVGVVSLDVPVRCTNRTEGRML